MERFNLPRLNQEDINRPGTSDEIQAVVKKKKKKKSFKKQRSSENGMAGDFYQTFTQELTLILKLFQKVAEGEEHYQISSIRPPSL